MNAFDKNERVNNQGMITMQDFTTALSLAAHPMIQVKPKLKICYYQSLECFIKAIGESEYIKARLGQYKSLLVGNKAVLPTLDNKEQERLIRSIVNNLTKPWRRKYRYWLLCDIALILSREELIKKAYNLLRGYLSNGQAAMLDDLYAAFWNDAKLKTEIEFAKPLVAQFRENHRFRVKSEKRLVVTANMSAGKSTLINAITGKSLTRTSQEACTANLCYLYNKPFEDGAIHLTASPLNLNASSEELSGIDKSASSKIASYFRTSLEPDSRVCIIDTPGVNSAINRHHGKITRKALLEEKYDTLLYVLNANRLGTDEEIKYLRWVAENVPKRKIVFVLNKVDNFKSTEDSITQSIKDVKNDLKIIGYENPEVYPVSAYCAYLIKLKQHGEPMDEDEINAYTLYAKKFSKPNYDLSPYYAHCVGVRTGNEDDKYDEALTMSKRCGIYGLETILFGGTL